MLPDSTSRLVGTTNLVQNCKGSAEETVCISSYQTMWHHALFIKRMLQRDANFKKVMFGLTDWNKKKLSERQEKRHPRWNVCFLLTSKRGIPLPELSDSFNYLQVQKGTHRGQTEFSHSSEISGEDLFMCLNVA